MENVEILKDILIKLKSYDEYLKEKKSEGYNNYNPLTVLRKSYDEVGLHSAFIYSLINPKGNHYRDDTFTKLFLKIVLKLENYGKIYDVRREYIIENQRRIDFYINTEKYKIAIEMKIYAGDQKNQISDYYKAVRKIASEDSSKEKVYYLSLYERDATKSSAKDRTYTKISFKDHILNWLKECIKAIKNEDKNELSNIIQSIEFYKEIIQILTKQKQKEKKIMDIVDYVKEKKVNLEDIFKIAPDIVEIQGKLFYEFFESFTERIAQYSIDNMDNIDDNIKNRKRVFNERKCKDFFSNKSSLNAGTFFKIDDEYLLNIFMAKKALYCAIRKYTKDGETYELKRLNKSNKDDSELFLELNHSSYPHQHFFSYSMILSDDNYKVIYDFENTSFAENFYKLLKKIKQYKESI
ncbi:MAG: Unknown protein [uncultured Campylobacterales bacterium]|uniref:PD-(D/E)XK nuclease superfamily protein n=1 Tax=uncultured Campylobacterales bacterium TaxID=352960 RepID=A0A6S6T901_9BACT|nr:MAG: Unknown protein [uncultured Campylobacterales bacterium]